MTAHAQRMALVRALGLGPTGRRGGLAARSRRPSVAVQDAVAQAVAAAFELERVAVAAFAQQHPAIIATLRALVAAGATDAQILARPEDAACLAQEPLHRALVVSSLRRLRAGEL